MSQEECTLFLLVSASGEAGGSKGGRVFLRHVGTCGPRITGSGKRTVLRPRILRDNTWLYDTMELCDQVNKSHTQSSLAPQALPLDSLTELR